MKFSQTNVPQEIWYDWKWQLRNRLDNKKDIRVFFPRISNSDLAAFNRYISKFNLGLTPYMLDLIEKDQDGNPIKGDPIWEQFRFFDYSGEIYSKGYDFATLNWELPQEMPSSMLHHKYPDRAIIRVSDHCFSYCNYCYLTMRLLDLEKEKGVSNNNVWQQSLTYLKNNPQIRDVLISGGEPLLLSNKRLNRIFEELRQIKSIKSIRLNTRALTHNPFRFGLELLKLFKAFQLTALEVHFAHPRELTQDVCNVLQSMDDVGYRPLVLWRSPLLRDVNDSYEVLEELFIKLYQNRIVPYYLFHFAPYALGRSVHSTSVKAGVKLMIELRRKLPGISIPRYTLFHPSGKQEIPLELDGTPSFVYERDNNNYPIIKFKNWRGEWVTYFDVED